MNSILSRIAALLLVGLAVVGCAAMDNGSRTSPGPVSSIDNDDHGAYSRN